jgi:PHS family inorganic phosphate transporter-like MFS transporter
VAQLLEALAEPGDRDPDQVAELLNSAKLSRFHRRAVIVSGVGFFTDAYDLFVIGTVAAMVSTQWHLSTTETSWVTGSAILAAFVGAFVFGRLADAFGRKVVYVSVAAIMIVGAIASALAQDFLWLVIARFVLGLGIGGDYPVSAVMMSEYANRDDRGRLVGLVFSMQALGLIVGPLVGLILLSSGIADDITWRLLLGFGAIPAAAAIYLRSRMPESPRYRAWKAERARGAASPEQARPLTSGLRGIVTNRRMLLVLVGTAGSWFFFDYAYYGNTLSLPAILKGVDPSATTMTKLALTLAMFVVFAVPGYFLAVWRMDRIGHRRLQLMGFAVMVVLFTVLAAVAQLTSVIGLFVAFFGVSYFFIEFGPNTTTFVLPSEVFPLEARTTGHGASAGIGKLGAFAGVFLVPQLQDAIGLRGMLAVAAGAAALGILTTWILPEPARRSLEELSPATRVPLESVERAAPSAPPKAPVPEDKESALAR